MSNSSISISRYRKTMKNNDCKPTWRMNRGVRIKYSRIYQDSQRYQQTKRLTHWPTKNWGWNPETHEFNAQVSWVQRRKYIYNQSFWRYLVRCMTNNVKMIWMWYHLMGVEFGYTTIYGHIGGKHDSVPKGGESKRFKWRIYFWRNQAVERLTKLHCTTPEKYAKDTGYMKTFGISWKNIRQILNYLHTERWHWEHHETVRQRKTS